jgi:hypothetical protein
MKQLKVVLMKKLLLTFAVMWTVAGVLSLPAFSQHRSHPPGTLTWIGALPVPGTSEANPFTAFDIIYVDPITQKMVLSSRSTKEVAIYDVFWDSVAGNTPAVFAGQTTGDNPQSGPDGSLIAGNQIWAGDYPSRVWVFDLNGNIIKEINVPNGTLRSDEMDYDPIDQVVLVSNGDPGTNQPFVSFISTRTFQIEKQVFFNGENGTPDATEGGLGAVLYDSATGKFLVSIPQVGSDDTNGAVAEMDPRTGAITNVFYGTYACQAAGMAQGPGENVLVGCDPGFPPPDFTIFAPRTYVINGRTGAVVDTFYQIGGEDESWYNPGDQRYYTGSRDYFTSPTATEADPVLGVIDADTNQWVENIPTGPNSHSVAANPLNNHIYVPVKYVSGAPPALCNGLYGCVAVFGYVQ